MTEFAPARDRDAWATVRGFVYQVDTTIVRWLALADGEALELECGEDIDHVRAALLDERLLEQIKASTGSITLASASAIEALANAVDHTAANPNLRLFFRFTTTAHVARERSHPRSDRPPGIELWELARQATTPHDDDVVLLSTILQGVTCPASLPLDVWSRARAAFSQLTDVRTLIGRFEWSCGAVSPDDISATIPALLRSSGIAPSEERARQLYEQLFLRVFRLLARRGQKTLTRAALNDELARQAVSDEDREVARALRESFDRCGLRVYALEQRVDVLGQHVQTIAQHVGLDVARFGEAEPDNDPTPPMLVTNLARRPALVADLMTQAAPWLAVVGEAGTGKTHLAQLVARARGGVAAWFRLRTGAGARHLSAQLMKWARAPSPTRVEVLRAVRARLTEGSSLIVEDVPRLQKDDPLCGLLAELADALRDQPRALITTSWYPLPDSIVQRGASVVAQRECPLFTDDEAAELFAAFGGSAFVAAYPKVVTSYNAFARRHPTLLSALAFELSQHGWLVDSGTFAGILDGTYAAGANTETLDFLNRTTAAPESRELLFRLTLGESEFAADTVYAVANAPPPIEHPFDRLAPAMGLWIRDEGRNRFRLSPLLSTLPKDRLQPETARACHRALAARLMKEPLDQEKGISVMTHLLQAGEVDRAGFTLAMLLRSIASDERRVSPGLLLEPWWTQPVPASMNLGVQLLLRSAQSDAGARYGKDAGHIDAEIDLLTERAQDVDQWGVAVAHVARFQRLFESDPARAAAAYVRALDAATRGVLPDGTPYPFPDLPALAWTQAARIRTSDQIHAWLVMIARLSPSARNWTDEDLRAKTCCQLVADRPWLTELDKPSDQQRWSDVHEVLDTIIQAAQRMRFPYLEACALRAKVAVLCEHNNRFDEGIATAQAFLGAHPEPEIATLMHDVVGRQYFHAGRYEDALKNLRLMLVDGPSVEPSLSCLVANYASRAAAEVEPDEALGYARRAVELADVSPRGGDEERVRARGELAIALWWGGDRVACVETLLEAAELFNVARADTRPWRVVGAALAQVIAMFSGAVLAGRGPPGFRRPDVPIPARGHFYSTPNLGKIWRDDFLTILGFQLCLLAEATGAIEGAKTWASRVLDTEAGVANDMLPVLQLQLLPYLLLTERADAIDAVTSATIRLVERMRAEKAEERPLETPSGILLWMTVMPLATALGLVATEDRPSARGLATSVAARLRSLGENSADAPRMWREAARLLETPHTDPSAAPALLEFARGLGDDDDALRTLASLQASVCEDVPLRDAAIVHLQLVPRLLIQAVGAEGRLLARWVERYWIVTFERRRFAFSTPGELARQFATLAPLPAATRVRRILGLVAGGLGLRLAPALSEWCSS